MAVPKVTNSSLWIEPPTGAGRLPVTAFFQESGGEYVLATTGTEDAALVDWHGDGVEAELLLTTSPYVMIDAGGGVLEPSASGTPAAIWIDDPLSPGDLLLSTDLTGIEAGAFYLSGNGTLVLARFDARKMQFLQLGDYIAGTL